MMRIVLGLLRIELAHAPLTVAHAVHGLDLLQIDLGMMRILADLLRFYHESQQIVVERGRRGVERQRLEVVHERREVDFAVLGPDSQQNRVESQQSELDLHHREAGRLALMAEDGRAGLRAAVRLLGSPRIPSGVR